MEQLTADGRAMAWMLGGMLDTDRIELPAVDGFNVAVRRVSADDQTRWQAKRKSRRTGWGALGDQGDAATRSYPYIAVPELILDCCTACAEISRSSQFSRPRTFDLNAPAHDAVDAGRLRFLAEAVADVVRLAIPDHPIQVALIEVVVVASDGPIIFTANAMLTPVGFRWRHLESRFSLSGDDAATLAVWWPRLTSGPNAELLRWPVRRLGVSRQRAFEEDQLIDLAIALEGLFVREEETRRSEANLIAARANRLLGGDRMTTRLRTNRVIQGYRRRSDLVHGRLPSEDDTARAVSGLDAVLVETLRALLAEATRVDPARTASR